MAYMRSWIAFALFWVNLVVSTLNIYFSIEIKPYSSSSRFSSSSSSSGSSYFPGTSKIPTIKIPSIKISTIKIPTIPKISYTPKFHKLTFSNLNSTKESLLERNLKYFLEKEIETPKELRKLSNNEIKSAILFINIGTFVFLIILLLSFFVTKNECCTYDINDGNALCSAGCCCEECMCCVDGDYHFSFRMPSNSGKEAGYAVLVGFILLLFFLVFKAVRACGKNVSRLIAIISLLLVNLTLAILSLYLGTGKFNISLAVFSLFAEICNLLGIILPNFASCKRLSYDYLYYEDDTINSDNSTPQQFLTAQPQNEMPLGEEAYPDSEDVMKCPNNQTVTPNISDTNPGYHTDNRYSVNSLDAGAPIYQVQNNDDNNQENISYPKPQ